jgi:hypothetical protein
MCRNRSEAMPSHFCVLLLDHLAWKSSQQSRILVKFTNRTPEVSETGMISNVVPKEQPVVP